MSLRALLILLLLALPRALAQGLPELGDASQAGFTPAQERRIGESIMREIRADRSYLDDPEAAEYLSNLGHRLAARSPDARQGFEFFLLRDPQINAFALPGGYIGVNTGLLLAAQSESEVASVLAHEIAHVTQRHIARMLAQQQQASVGTLAAFAAALLLSRVSGQAAAAPASGTAAGSKSRLTSPPGKSGKANGAEWRTSTRPGSIRRRCRCSSSGCSAPPACTTAGRRPTCAPTR